MSSYLSRYNHYLSPTRDYLTLGLFDDSQVERRRSPPEPSVYIRDEREPAPFHMCGCLVESSNQKGRLDDSDDDEERTPVFLNTYRTPLCTVDYLLKIIRKPEGHFQLPTDAYNQVFPDVYLSDALTAMSIGLLKRLRITHVINAAQGTGRDGSGFVNTSESFYTPAGIKFLGIHAFDDPLFRIYHHFEDVADFMADALRHGGKVLVHCQAGISRSATLVCAFLMLKRGLSVQDAVKTVRQHRAIIPNKGFLQQLCDLNERIKRRTEY